MDKFFTGVITVILYLIAIAIGIFILALLWLAIKNVVGA